MLKWHIAGTSNAFNRRSKATGDTQHAEYDGLWSSRSTPRTSCIRSGAGDSRVRGGAGGGATVKVALYFLYSPHIKLRTGDKEARINGTAHGHIGGDEGLERNQPDQIPGSGHQDPQPTLQVLSRWTEFLAHSSFHIK